MYCTQDDIVPAKLSEAKLSQLTCDTVDEIDDDVVDDAIKAADGEINSYCGKRYVVPFEPVPSRIKTLCVNIAVYKLYERRINETAGEIPKSVRDMYTDGISFLKLVAAGQAIIDGYVKPAPDTTNTGGYFHANKRIDWKQ